MNGWSADMPTEPGFFWFYGYTDIPKETRGEVPELRLIHIRQNALGRLLFAFDYSFVHYPARGIWLRIDEPEIPYATPICEVCGSALARSHYERDVKRKGRKADRVSDEEVEVSKDKWDCLNCGAIYEYNMPVPT